MRSIGEAAALTGLKQTTIRFYEQEGLVAPPSRTESGRRLYSDVEVRRLSFIRHARGLGFELDDVRSLLGLSDRPEQACAAADRIARRHLEEVEQRLIQLTALKQELTRIVRSCAENSGSECRIIEALSENECAVVDHSSAANKVKVAKRRRK